MAIGKARALPVLAGSQAVSTGSRSMLGSRTGNHKARLPECGCLKPILSSSNRSTREEGEEDGGIVCLVVADTAKTVGGMARMEALGRSRGGHGSQWSRRTAALTSL
jgi:hypothetical protein